MTTLHNSEYHQAIVIGAGQAGLSMSYCLQQENIENLILEQQCDIAGNWRLQRWDTFSLVTPNWQCQLPGFHYCGEHFNGADPHGFMVKNDIIHYLESYADFFKPNIRFNCTVVSVIKVGHQFVLKTNETTYITDQVIIACGSYHKPFILPASHCMNKDIKHIHSRDYKNPADISDGEILVVGTGQSGCQIAEDLHLAGKKVHLAVGTAPRVNRRYKGRDVVDWLDDMGHYQMTIDKHPDPENAAHATNHYVTGRDGGHDLNLRVFAQQGMKLYGRLKDADQEHIYFYDDLKENMDNADKVAQRILDSIEEYIQKNDLRTEEDTNIYTDFLPETNTKINVQAHNIKTVIWATGFKMNFDWIKLDAFDSLGRPKTQKGVTKTSGLYFLGLNWMNTWGSGRFYQVGRDAEYLCEHIVNQKINALGTQCA